MERPVRRRAARRATMNADQGGPGGPKDIRADARTHRDGRLHEPAGSTTSACPGDTSSSRLYGQALELVIAALCAGSRVRGPQFPDLQRQTPPPPISFA